MTGFLFGLTSFYKTHLKQLSIFLGKIFKDIMFDIYM